MNDNHDINNKDFILVNFMIVQIDGKMFSELKCTDTPMPGMAHKMILTNVYLISNSYQPENNQIIIKEFIKRKMP